MSNECVISLKYPKTGFSVTHGSVSRDTEVGSPEFDFRRYRKYTFGKMRFMAGNFGDRNSDQLNSIREKKVLNELYN